MAVTLQEHIANGGKVDLIALTKQHMDTRKLSIQELAGRLGLSRSLVSQYLGGIYSKPETVEERLLPYLQEQGVTVEAGDDTCNPFIGNQPGSRFYQSTDARRIVAVCSACHEFAELGVITGKSGYGKTYTLKQYAQLPKVIYIECDDTMGRRDLVETLESSLGLSLGYGTLFRRTQVIIEFLNKNPGYLIIVDEADKLISKASQKKMEVLRKLVDKSKVGIVIAGEPQLKPLLECYDARFANRGNYGYELVGLTKLETVDYLSALPIDQPAQDVLIVRACNSRNGCFRLLDRTLGNVIRLVKDRSATQITMELVEEASDMMML